MMLSSSLRNKTLIVLGAGYLLLVASLFFAPLIFLQTQRTSPNELFLDSRGSGISQIIDPAFTRFIFGLIIVVITGLIYGASAWLLTSKVVNPIKNCRWSSITLVSIIDILLHKDW